MSVSPASVPALSMSEPEYSFTSAAGQTAS
ncbi:hypothetical protein ACVWW1_006536 [Bradyrhizobium sp. JR3.5]